MPDLANLSPETIREAVETLYYLKREHDRFGRIDRVDMGHVFRVLDRIEIESMIKRERIRKREGRPLAAE